MARQKKDEIGKVESHFDTVARFIKQCHRDDGALMSITARYGDTYLINGLLYTFTKAVKDDMVESGQVKVTYENDDLANLSGISL